jgi:uncharacterized surface protein with fasciclin (FAS1) repeats
MSDFRIHRLLASLALSAAVITGCATTPAPATLADTVARTPQLGTLARLLGDAGLADTLRGTGPFTVFAPSDDAFKALPAKTLAEIAADKELLKSVLSFHVLAGRVASADARNGNLKTVQGANVAVAKAGDFLTVEDAVVTQADLMASNGVVHIIDKVMLPPKR